MRSPIIFLIFAEFIFKDILLIETTESSDTLNMTDPCRFSIATHPKIPPTVVVRIREIYGCNATVTEESTTENSTHPCATNNFESVQTSNEGNDQNLSFTRSDEANHLAFNATPTKYTAMQSVSMYLENEIVKKPNSSFYPPSIENLTEITSSTALESTTEMNPHIIPTDSPVAETQIKPNILVEITTESNLMKHTSYNTENIFDNNTFSNEVSVMEGIHARDAEQNMLLTPSEFSTGNFTTELPLSTQDAEQTNLGTVTTVHVLEDKTPATYQSTVADLTESYVLSMPEELKLPIQSTTPLNTYNASMFSAMTTKAITPSTISEKSSSKLENNFTNLPINKSHTEITPEHPHEWSSTYSNLEQETSNSNTEQNYKSSEIDKKKIEERVTQETENVTDISHTIVTGNITPISVTNSHPERNNTRNCKDHKTTSASEPQSSDSTSSTLPSEVNTNRQGSYSENNNSSNTKKPTKFNLTTLSKDDFKIYPLTITFHAYVSQEDWFRSYDVVFKLRATFTLNTCRELKNWNNTFLPNDVSYVEITPYYKNGRLYISILIFDPLSTGYVFLPGKTLIECFGRDLGQYKEMVNGSIVGLAVGIQEVQLLIQNGRTDYCESFHPELFILISTVTVGLLGCSVLILLCCLRCNPAECWRRSRKWAKDNCTCWQKRRVLQITPRTKANLMKETNMSPVKVLRNDLSRSGQNLVTDVDSGRLAEDTSLMQEFRTEDRGLPSTSGAPVKEMDGQKDKWVEINELSESTI